MKENTLEEQLELEKESNELTISRFDRRHSQAADRGDFENSDAGRAVVSALIVKLKSYLEEQVSAAQSGKAGRRTTLAGYITELPLSLEEISFLTLRSVINQLMISRSGNITDAVVSRHISSRLIDETFLRSVKRNDERLVAKWTRECEQRSLSREASRIFMMRQARNMEMSWTFHDSRSREWDTDVQLKVGRMLLEAVALSTGMIYLKLIQVKPKQRRKFVFPSAEFEAYMDKLQEHLISRSPLYLPCVIEPKDWDVESGLYGGGYFSDDVRPYPLVKKASPEWLDQIADNDPEVLVSSLNAIQKTPWRINKTVLEALKHVYERDRAEAGLPNSSKEDLPPAPEEYNKDYRRLCWEVHERNRRQLTQRLFVTQVVWLAEKFSEYEKFYFPHDLDSRGRAYPKPAFLNPQGPDYVKGLLEFANAKPLGTPEAAAWLAVHVANCWGEDKLALNDRIKWTESNSEMLCEIADNPLDDLRWTQADSPFQFLQACQSWKLYETQGLDAEVHCPIAVDATCSGLQHYSAMLLDPVGGRAVNLLDLPDRQDVYQDVANETLKLVKGDIGGDFNNLAQAWIEFGIDRKITKRSVMVVPYAATYISCVEYTREAVKEKLAKGTELPWVGDENEFIHYGAKKIWKAIENTVVAASEAMRWISKAASTYARVSGQTRLVWGTPSGMVVWHRKPALKEWRMNTVLDGSRVQMQAQREQIGLDPSKMSTSTPPSFVHSMDAAHMCLAIDAAYHAGLKDFGVVHDSFATHAADMEVFSQCIRDTFHEMYTSQDILGGLREQLQEHLEEPLDELPVKGDLDLDEVRTSQFFFS